MDKQRLADDILLHASAFAASSLIRRDPPMVIGTTMSQILEEAFQPLSLDRTWRYEDKTAYSAHRSPILLPYSTKLGVQYLADSSSERRQ
jgi:hypothetical protein